MSILFLNLLIHCILGLQIIFLNVYDYGRWGGPLPQSWLDQQLQLQKQILGRMRELGMNPGTNFSFKSYILITFSSSMFANIIFDNIYNSTCYID